MEVKREVGREMLHCLRGTQRLLEHGRSGGVGDAWRGEGGRLVLCGEELRWGELQWRELR